MLHDCGESLAGARRERPIFAKAVKIDIAAAKKQLAAAQKVCK